MVQKKLVLATGNRGKIDEFRALFAPLGVEIIPQGELNVPAADEPYGTFLENALAKARNASRATGLPAMADDSGITAEALGNAPGVHSARYAGEHATDRQNNEKLVADLKGNPNRKAHYTCVLVAVRSADDPDPIVAEGRWHGEILDFPRGMGGFGYDPYFYVPSLKRTAAEFGRSQKNSVSHRGKAMRAMLSALRDRWGW